ncbi:MAG: hypothetical protein JNM60_09575 [Candidatus Competibacteraceae bacterium]|nr:hypothetical protein [Candidatus Competibacteraceae bacterium]
MYHHYYDGPTFPPPPLFPPYYFWLAALMIVVCLVAGAVLLSLVERRRFYRTNAAGVETFKDYGSLLKARWSDRMIRLAAVGCFASSLIAAFYAIIFF